MNKKPLVSVIIPTMDSAETIEACLKSIRKQSYQKTEIIVVDAFSTDGTDKISEKHGAIVIEIKMGRSEARNVGVEEANGDLILSLDSDMELTPWVIEECVKKTKEGYDSIIIPEESVGKGFWAECKALEKSLYVGDDLIEASRFFRREVFEAVGGYDTELEFGEDWDLNNRIKKSGFPIGRINTFIKHHKGKFRLWKTIKKKYQYGKTLKRYEKKHPNEARRQLKLIRPAFIKNWKKLARVPIPALGMLFMKVCEFGAAWIGYFLSKKLNLVRK